MTPAETTAVSSEARESRELFLTARSPPFIRRASGVKNITLVDTRSVDESSLTLVLVKLEPDSSSVVDPADVTAEFNICPPPWTVIVEPSLRAMLRALMVLLTSTVEEEAST
jgi:hypothetical protein